MRDSAGDGAIRFVFARLYILNSCAGVRRRKNSITDREEHNETTGISQSGGRRDRDVHDRRAGHRAINAGVEKAVYGGGAPRRRAHPIGGRVTCPTTLL